MLLAGARIVAQLAAIAEGVSARISYAASGPFCLEELGGPRRC
jgi:hypothetical protein